MTDLQPTTVEERAFWRDAMRHVFDSHHDTMVALRLIADVDRLEVKNNSLRLDAGEMEEHIKDIESENAALRAEAIELKTALQKLIDEKGTMVNA